MFLDFRYWSDPKQRWKRLMFRDLVPKEENPGHVHASGRQPGAEGGLDQGPGTNPVGAGGAQQRYRKRLQCIILWPCEHGRYSKPQFFCHFNLFEFAPVLMIHVQMIPSHPWTWRSVFQRSVCRRECSWESETSRSWTSSPVRQPSATEPSTVFWLDEVKSLTIQYFLFR